MMLISQFAKDILSFKIVVLIQMIKANIFQAKFFTFKNKRRSLKHV